ncbi:MAG TPA: biotin/lipoyl-containing protein, partial [Geomonas sp.]
MSFDFKLPDLGEGIAEVELRRWLVAEGERVAEHQALLEVETDKAVVEVPAPRAGTVTRIYRQEGE